MDSASASGAERAGSNPAEGTILQVKSESSFFCYVSKLSHIEILGAGLPAQF